MNTNPDSPLNEANETAADAAVDAIPARPPRKRRAPRDAETPAAAEPAAASAEGEPGASKRRRRKPGDTAPTTHVPAGAEFAAPDEASVPAGEAPGDEPAAPVEAPGAAPPPAERAPIEAGEDEDEDAETSAAERPAPTDANELFAQVVSGGFDSESEAPADEAAAPRRVLAPEPEAPKLQKVLAQAGVGSRRDMEQLIADGAITVNGEPAHTGQRVSFGDRIAVNGKPIRFRIAPPLPRILAYHKPVGEVVTHHDPENRPTVFRRLPRLPHGKWQSVGRLDINTEGLLLFTNSGDLANQLMHPRFGVEREYAVRVLGKLDEDQREELLDGVEVDGQEASFKSIEDGGGEGANHWYRVVITEGRNREVRKLFEAIGLTVSRLIRIRYGTVVLPRGLKRGVWVDLDETDVRAIRKLAGGQVARTEGNGPPERRNGRRGRDRQRGGERGAPQPQANAPREEDDDFDPARIPNPLEQTFDRRFAQKGHRGGMVGFGSPNAPRHPSGKQGGSGGPRQPDPMQTSVGYIGADAFHRKSGRGGGFGGGGGGGSGGRGRRGR